MHYIYMKRTDMCTIYTCWDWETEWEQINIWCRNISTVYPAVEGTSAVICPLYSQKTENKVSFPCVIIIKNVISKMNRVLISYAKNIMLGAIN